MKEKGLAPIFIVLIVVLILAGLGGGFAYLKLSNPQPAKSPNADQSSSQNSSSSVDSIFASEKASKMYDGVIKYDFKEIFAKSLACQYKLNNNRYPDTFTKFNDKCGPHTFPNNPNTNKPHYYIVTNDGTGYILKAKLSTGEVYTVTEATYPNP